MTPLLLLQLLLFINQTFVRSLHNDMNSVPSSLSIAQQMIVYGDTCTIFKLSNLLDIYEDDELDNKRLSLPNSIPSSIHEVVDVDATANDEENDDDFIAMTIDDSHTNDDERRKNSMIDECNTNIMIE